MKLAYARLVTRDVPKLADFYSQILGILPVGSDEYVELRTSGWALSIVSKRSSDIFSAGAAEPAANRSVILDFEVENVDREYIRLQRHIGKFILTPTDQPWGNRSMLFRDPDGNLINLFTTTSGRRGFDQSASSRTKGKSWTAHWKRNVS